MEKSIASLLESEIQASDEFSKMNFGMKVGDGFPELVREVCGTEKVPMRLFLNLALGALLGKSVCEEVAALTKDDNGRLDLGSVIVRNLSIFETPLALLWWGIQIGRKMEREEAEALRKLEE